MTLPQQPRYSVTYVLTPMLCGISYVLSQTTADTKTRRVLSAGGTEAEFVMHVMHHCLVIKCYKYTSI